MRDETVDIVTRLGANKCSSAGFNAGGAETLAGGRNRIGMTRSVIGADHLQVLVNGTIRVFGRRTRSL